MKKKTIFIIISLAAIVGLFFFLKANFANEMYVDPTILTIGPLKINWYGFLIASGIVLCYMIGRKLAMNEGVKDEQVAEAVIISVLFAIVGARLYYVFSTWEMFSENPIEIFMTWHGGLAIHGGVIGAMLGLFLFTRLRKKCTFTFFQGADYAALLLPLGQGIGRWGNFFNHEAYGSPTDLPWKMYVPPQFRMWGYENFEFFHPTFLYESVWDIMIFAFMFWIFKNKRKKFGEMVAYYFILYSIGRFFIEGLRLDSLYWGELRAAQVISVILIVSGFILLYLLRKFGTDSTFRIGEEKNKGE